MAKSDFSFTFYDGDCASDTQHMNRLERGAYMDCIMFQRKKIQRAKSATGGHFSIDELKTFLNRDFENVWAALKLILCVDAGGLFFIEWLENSEIRAKAHAQKQSEKRTGKTKFNQTITEINQTTTEQEPNETKSQPNDNQKKPLGDGDGDGDEFENEKGMQGEKQFSSGVENLESELRSALDPIYLEQQAMKWRKLDFEFETKAFIEKVRGSPDAYADHDKGGLRLAFQYQLRNAKEKKQNQNGIDKINADQRERDAIIAAKFAAQKTEPATFDVGTLRSS